MFLIEPFYIIRIYSSLLLYSEERIFDIHKVYGIFTCKDFKGLSLMLLSVQIRNSMQIFWGSNSTNWTHKL